jgi:hypothetical protein
VPGRRDLRRSAALSSAAYIVAEAIKAVGISKTLVCSALDLDALAEFANTWSPARRGRDRIRAVDSRHL